MLEEDLKKLSVFELRKLARSMGVISPTSKKNNELISEILAIHNGEKTPTFSKMGRPPKDKTAFDKVLNQLKETSLANFDYEHIKPEMNYAFCAGKEDSVNSKEYEVFGVVRQVSNSFYVKDYLGNIEYGLIADVGNVKLGDLIIGRANDFNSNFKKIKTFEKYNFANNEVISFEDKARVVELGDVCEMHNFVKTEKGNKGRSV